MLKDNGEIHSKFEGKLFLFLIFVPRLNYPSNVVTQKPSQLTRSSTTLLTDIFLGSPGKWSNKPRNTRSRTVAPTQETKVVLGLWIICGLAGQQTCWHPLLGGVGGARGLQKVGLLERRCLIPIPTMPYYQHCSTLYKPSLSYPMSELVQSPSKFSLLLMRLLF